MTRLKSVSNSVAARAAVIGGAAFAAGGITELVHSQRASGTKVEGVAGYLSLSFFAVALIAIAPVFVALARRARSQRADRAALAAAGGTAILGLTAVTSLVNGSDLAVFGAVAAVTNLAWVAGSIVIAVALKRAASVPRAISIGLPVAWVAAIPLATIGGGVIAGAYFIAVGHRLLAEETAGEASVAAQPTAA
jgi:hypothetical protein